MKIIEQHEHVVKVAITLERRDGSQYTTSLEGDEAAKWDRYTDVLTDIARNENAYPPFDKLKWKSEEN